MGIWQCRSVGLRRVALLAVALGPLVFVARCFSDLDALSSGSDAMVDGEGGMAAKDFSISVSPSYVAIAPGQAQTVTVSVQRVGTFTGVVNIALTLPPYVTPPTISNFPISGANTNFTLTSTVAAAPALAQNNALGDFPLTVVGVSGNEPPATAPLTVHLSGLLATFDKAGDGGAAPFNVPSNVPLLRVKAWGAGGGSGGYCSSSCTYTSNAGGGGGGFVLTDVPVTPNEILGVVVGAAGPNGGYGGGYSAVRRGTVDTLVIAGGGGGGGTWFANADCTAGWGGAGGGVNGQDGHWGDALGGCSFPAQYGPGGGGATQTANGTDHTFGGGGGGGLYTGGTGGTASCTPGLGQPGGGGGGSGGTGVYDAGIVVDANVTGNGVVPANTTDLDYGDAGAGVGAAACQGNGACTKTGGAGRVVILVP